MAEVVEKILSLEMDKLEVKLKSKVDALKEDVDSTNCAIERLEERLIELQNTLSGRSGMVKDNEDN